MSDRKDIEQHLRAALEPKQPPADFAQRVLARAEQDARPTGWRSWAAGCIAASLLLGTLGVRQVEERRERERGEAAKTQLVQALTITSHTLQRIQKKLDGLNHE